jgi:hypothetical protein
MKNLIIILLAFALPFFGYSQKIESQNIQFTLQHYPEKPIPPRFISYIVNSTVESGHQSIEGKLNLDLGGMTKVQTVTDKKSTIEVELTFKNATSKPGKTKKVVKGYTTFFGYEYITYQVDYSIYGYKKENGTYVRHQYYSGSLVEKSTLEVQAGSAVEARAKIDTWARKDKVQEIVDQVLDHKLNDRLNDQFMRYNAQRTLKIYTVSKFKKFDYADLNKAQKIASDAISNYSKDKNLEVFQKAVTPAIEIWKNNARTQRIENKKARINQNVNAIIYQNLSTVYFLIENYKIYNYYATQLKKMDTNYSEESFFKKGDQKDQKRIDKYNEALKTSDFQDV